MVKLLFFVALVHSYVSLLLSENTPALFVFAIPKSENCETQDENDGVEGFVELLVRRIVDWVGFVYYMPLSERVADGERCEDVHGAHVGCLDASGGVGLWIYIHKMQILAARNAIHLNYRVL